MLNFLKEIHEDTGYYYTNERLDLHDFVILVAFIIISTSLVIVEFIYSLQEITPESIFLFAMICIIFISPFLAHFLVKTFKILSFRRKKKKILTYLINSEIPYNYYLLQTGDIIVNCYCYSQKQSQVVREILNECNAKYFVSESKTL